MTTKLTFLQKQLEAQKKIGAITKSKENPFFKSMYADINAYLSEVKPVLNELGLVLTQPTVILEGRNVLQTIITDSDTGEFIKSELYIPENPDIQKFGGMLTYIRRYQIQTLLGLEAEDDDGNKASGKKVSEPINSKEDVPFI